jgi:hypothetical protein
MTHARAVHAEPTSGRHEATEEGHAGSVIKDKFTHISCMNGVAGAEAIHGRSTRGAACTARLGATGILVKAVQVRQATVRHPN